MVCLSLVPGGQGRVNGSAICVNLRNLRTTRDIRQVFPMLFNEHALCRTGLGHRRRFATHLGMHPTMTKHQGIP